MEPMAQILAFLAVPVGAVFCFAGYRVIKVVLGVVGFFVGAATTAGIAYVWLDLPEVAALVIGLIGGIAGAFLVGFLYFVGVFLLGGGFGASLGFVIGNETAVEPLIPVVILGISGGVLGLIIQKLIIIVSTAGVGSWSVVAGVASILGFLPPQLLLRNPWATWSVLRTHDFLLIVWALLFAAGIVVQYRSAPEAKKAEKKEE